MRTEKIRILQVVPTMSKASGITRYVWNMLNGSDRSDFDFDFLYHTSSEVSYEKESEALGFGMFKAPDAAKDPISYVKYVNDLMVNVGGEYSIVHCHIPNAAFCVLKSAKKVKIKNRLIHSHLAASSEYPSHRLRNYPLIKYGKRLATHNLACSEDAGRYLFGTKPFRVFRNGVDVKAFSYDEKASNALKNQLLTNPSAFPVIGCVGRLSRQKNYPFMIKVFKELLQEEKQAELLIAGGGPEQQTIEALIDQMGLKGKVHLLGVREDVNKLYSAMDVFAMPSLCEGLPVAAVEAQAAGLRCVFSRDVPAETDIAGVSEFLDRKAPINEWCQALMNLARKGRNISGEKSIDAAGYSLRSSSALLFDFYRSIV